MDESIMLGVEAVGDVYNQALAANQANYSQILAGYTNAIQSQQAQQRSVRAGYKTLQANVMNTLEGIDESQKQAIRDAYTAQAGKTEQQLISSGLGNTTVRGSMQRGITLDEQKAQIELANKMANLRAGYQSNLGLAELSYANQIVGQNTALLGARLGYMGSNNALQGQMAGGYMNTLASLYGRGASQGGGGGGGIMGGNANKGFLDLPRGGGRRGGSPATGSGYQTIMAPVGGSGGGGWYEPGWGLGDWPDQTGNDWSGWEGYDDSSDWSTADVYSDYIPDDWSGWEGD